MKSSTERLSTPDQGFCIDALLSSRGSLLALQVLEIGICRSQLPFEIKTSLALTSVETLAPMLQLPAVPSSMSTARLKSLVAISASIYPLIFRHLCSNKTNTLLWGTLSRLRDVILRWATEGVDERRQRVPRGVRLSAIKFLQRVVLVQTKGSNDPRVRLSLRR